MQYQVQRGCLPFTHRSWVTACQLCGSSKRDAMDVQKMFNFQHSFNFQHYPMVTIHPEYDKIELFAPFLFHIHWVVSAYLCIVHCLLLLAVLIPGRIVKNLRNPNEFEKEKLLLTPLWRWLSYTLHTHVYLTSCVLRSVYTFQFLMDRDICRKVGGWWGGNMPLLFTCSAGA